MIINKILYNLKKIKNKIKENKNIRKFVYLNIIKKSNLNNSVSSSLINDLNLNDKTHFQKILF